MFYKFSPNDIFYNQLKATPEVNFIIYDQKIYYNNKTNIPGKFVKNTANSALGTVDLYENNVDRQANNFIYPFVTKDGSLNTLNSVSLDDFNVFTYGNIITSSYPLTASLSSDRYIEGQDRPAIVALQTALNSYGKYSAQFPVISSLSGAIWNKLTQELRLISIPSIFYGSSIQRGSIELNFYVSGILMAQLVDDRRNGELKQRLPQDINSGSVAGVALYDHGFLLLTGSWNISQTHQEVYNIYTPSVPSLPRWIDFATTGSTTPLDGTNVPSSSFSIDFNGIQYSSVITMFAHAKKSELNFSNNPTFISYNQTGTMTPMSSTTEYIEHSDIQIKNVVQSSFIEPTASFEKQTYISRIGIFDKNKNLIAITKFATPIRKREIDEFTFKIKLDL